jgi:hypothetical protein
VIRAVPIIVVALAACGPGPRPAYPGVLHPPSALGPDFMVRQSLTIHATRDGKPVTAELDAVLQKRGAELLVLGLGPMDQKAFTLTQRASAIDYQHYMGPRLAFEPRDMLVDIHRVFFKRLPGPPPEGTRGGELDGEHVEETWHDGELRRIAYTRPGERFVGAVRVELGPGCKPARCEPATATLRNEWFGYTVEIANEAFEWL